MNDWLHPSLLETNTAASLVNADESSGKIVPIKRPIRMTISDPVQYGHYGTRDRSLVKWYNRFYWSNNTALTSPYYGGNEENYLGIPFPAYSGSSANVAIEESTPESGEPGLDGSYKYCVCFVNPNGWEGAPGSLSEYETAISISGKWAKITVTWDSEDARISYAKVYRTGDKGADFYCVGEIHTSGGNLVDKTDDTILTMLNPLVSTYNYPPPDGGKYLCEYGGVFFLAVDSLLYFSIQGNPHAWPQVQYLSFDDTITGIVPEFQGVLVFTKNKVFRVVGADSPDTVTKTYIPGNHGCINFRSISVLSNAPVWLSNDGICLWDGNSITIPSYQVLNTNYLGVKYAVSANDKYYLFHTSGGIIFDRKNGDIFYKIDFSCDYAWYDGDNDCLYILIGDALFQYGRGNNLTFRYVSGNIGGDEITQKIFEELLISCDGESDISIHIEDVEKFSIRVPAGRNRVKLPFSAVGRYLSLHIRSSEKLNEIGITYE